MATDAVALQSPPPHNSNVNGSEPKIEIFKPFGEAFELMKKILFQLAVAKLIAANPGEILLLYCLF
ncbi:MAG: hypothetical protein DME90_09370 [Verrucomicrobia bacterium]|nr:MAG: hypothetical protein DME90_09370 [Verrucomicrobiota bacterium]